MCERSFDFGKMYIRMRKDENPKDLLIENELNIKANIQ